jgi:hypothetical protein
MNQNSGYRIKVDSESQAAQRRCVSTKEDKGHQVSNKEFRISSLGAFGYT